MLAVGAGAVSVEGRHGGQSDALDEASRDSRCRRSLHQDERAEQELCRQDGIFVINLYNVPSHACCYTSDYHLSLRLQRAV
jgi:hypothetical protein